ncbi:FAD-dependent oxidoreductase [Streptomyces tirandamycinicus]|uniref:Monooxygenase n=1 Tax=Streptomyces tirandamycinicus TaxID=2174846 RepID=A0A2S1SUL0_9ACTN|nr:FAD-dependent monooxygenase [Streptomyces tirandamycinicus]AWI30081.1 monooxygenase [Streptomyces tirandamycinicus]
MVNHARDKGGRRPHGNGRHAVVIGGSLAGLLAAHVLAGHADRVTVVERDRIPDGPEPRPGVPQSRHAHVLLESGQLALDSLLPGFTAELRAAGAPRVGMPEDMVAWSGGAWVRRTAPTTHIHTGSRAHLEHLVRRRVLADPAIRTVESAEAVGLAGDASRVRGVLLRERGGTGGTAGAGASGRRQRTLPADLVVDASGRGSRAPQWLAAIGAEPPAEETIDTGQAYASRVYRDTGAHLGTEALAYWFYPNPAQTYAGGVLPLEDGSHLVALAGLRGQEPPTDDAGFTAFAARLPHPFLHEWLLTAEPRTPVYGFRATANLRRRYDRPGRRPAGFLATGDALCTFNPIYGQGMSVAAMSAVALRDALADPRRRPTTLRVQRALFDASRQAWDISAGADRAMPGAVGNAVASRAVDRPVGWYLNRVQRRYVGDPALVGPVFRSVLTLTAPLSALFAPRVARAVLFGPVARPPAAPPMRAETTGG